MTIWICIIPGLLQGITSHSAHKKKMVCSLPSCMADSIRAPVSVSISAGVKNRGVAMPSSSSEVQMRASNGGRGGRCFLCSHQCFIHSSITTKGACTGIWVTCVCMCACLCVCVCMCVCVALSIGHRHALNALPFFMQQQKQGNVNNNYKK